MRARSVILAIAFVVGCLLFIQGILSFVVPRIVPHYGTLNMALMLLGLIIIQICTAVWMNWGLHVKHPTLRPFRWGYWNGLSCFLLTPLIGTAAAGPNAFVGYEVILIPIGVFVLLRHRWAFIVATVFSFNPVYYVANTIYIVKRWEEMRSPQHHTLATPPSPRVTSAFSPRIGDLPATLAAPVAQRLRELAELQSVGLISDARNEKRFLEASSNRRQCGGHRPPLQSFSRNRGSKLPRLRQGYGGQAPFLMRRNLKRTSNSPRLCARQQARHAIARRIRRTRRNSSLQFGQR
jgi:hypothetical protein